MGAAALAMYIARKEARKPSWSLELLGLGLGSLWHLVDFLGVPRLSITFV